LAQHVIQPSPPDGDEHGQGCRQHHSPSLLAIESSASHEAASLWFTLSCLLADRPSWTILKWLAVPLWLPAAWLVLVMLFERSASWYRGKHMKRDPQHGAPT
jgi:hypothetical protein